MCNPVFANERFQETGPSKRFEVSITTSLWSYIVTTDPSFLRSPLELEGRVDTGYIGWGIWKESEVTVDTTREHKQGHFWYSFVQNCIRESVISGRRNRTVPVTSLVEDTRVIMRCTTSSVVSGSRHSVPVVLSLQSVSCNLNSLLSVSPSSGLGQRRDGQYSNFCGHPTMSLLTFVWNFIISINKILTKIY